MSVAPSPTPTPMSTSVSPTDTPAPAISTSTTQPTNEASFTVEISDAIAFTALLVSLWALLRPWWQQREARIEVRLEEYQRGFDNPHTRNTRIVIVNHGPADARDIKIGLRLGDEPSNVSIHGLSLLETPSLYAGEEHHIMLMMAFGDQYPDSVVVEWSDRRWDRQARTFWPSVRQL